MAENTHGTSLDLSTLSCIAEYSVRGYLKFAWTFRTKIKQKQPNRQTNHWNHKYFKEERLWREGLEINLGGKLLPS